MRFWTRRGSLGSYFGGLLLQGGADVSFSCAPNGRPSSPSRGSSSSFPTVTFVSVSGRCSRSDRWPLRCYPARLQDL